MGSKRPVKTAAQANANWVGAMQSPTTSAKYTQGVDAVTQSPNHAAASAEAQAKYAAKTQEAIASGRMAAANMAVSVDKWKSATKQGAARLSSGAANAREAHMRAANKMAPGWQAARDAASSIPSDGSEASALAKVAAAMRAMKQAAGKA